MSVARMLTCPVSVRLVCILHQILSIRGHPHIPTVFVTAGVGHLTQWTIARRPEFSLKQRNVPSVAASDTFACVAYVGPAPPVKGAVALKPAAAAAAASATTGWVVGTASGSLWRVDDTGQVVDRKEDVHQDGVTAVCISSGPTPFLVTGGADTCVRVWDPTTLTLRASVDLTSAFANVPFSPGSDVVALDAQPNQGVCARETDKNKNMRDQKHASHFKLQCLISGG